MKKCITRSISLMLTLIMMVVFMPFTFKTMDTNAAPVQYNDSIGYEGGEVTWKGFDTRYIISYEKNGIIADTRVYNSNRIIRIYENTSTSQRVATVTAKRNGTAVAVLRIVQDGKPQEHYHSYTIKSSASYGVYAQCSCGYIEKTNCSFNDYLYYTNSSDTKDSRKAYLKLYFSAKTTKFSGSKLDKICDTLADAFSLYNEYKNNVYLDLLEELSRAAEFTSNASYVGDFTDTEVFNKIGAFSDYYQVGHSMFKLLRSNDYEDAGVNMLETCSKAMSLCPITDVLYGKVFSYISSYAVDIAYKIDKLHNHRIYMLFLYVEDLTNDDNYYANMTINQICDNADNLFSDKATSNKKVLSAFLDAKVAYEIYKYRYNTYKGDFWDFYYDIM